MTKSIAVIGSGISGLISASRLSRKYAVSLFESNSYLGGHTHTVDVTHAGQCYPVDLGFIVFNKKTYPNFAKILKEYSVPIQKSEMSFSYRSSFTDFEYNGNNLNTLFADRRNLLRPTYYGFLKEIILFNKHAKKFLTRPISELSILEFAKIHNYSKQFINHYLVPMIAAIWSKQPNEVFNSSAYFFLNFYLNHGLLDTFNRPKWFVIKGGSREYIPKLVSPNKINIYLNHHVDEIERQSNQVIINANGNKFLFDKVVIASHSDQALAMLKNPSPQEIAVLSEIKYQPNEVVLHTDSNILPKRKLAWASWNYFDIQSTLPTLTYYLNRLQNLSAKENFFVSLNLTTAIEKEKIILKNTYSHPCFSLAALKAQKDHHLINGTLNTYYAGAYWGSGFHEDGVVSALKICAQLGVEV